MSINAWAKALGADPLIHGCFSRSRQLAEREGIRLYPCIQKLDLECSIDDWLGLSNQLMEPLIDDRSITALVHIHSVRGARWLPIDRHAKANGTFSSRWTHYEMEIARVKAVDDPAVRAARDGRLPAHRPIATQCPLIE